MPDNKIQQTIGVPRHIAAAVGELMATAARHRRRSQALDEIAAGIIDDYCAALGIDPSHFEYNPSTRKLTSSMPSSRVVPEPTPVASTTNSETAEQVFDPSYHVNS